MTAALSFAQRLMIWKNAAVSTRTPTKSSSSSSPSQVSRLDRFFHITERGSSISREIRGGIVTFFSMSYILVLNPAILSKASPPGTEAQLAAGTAFVAAVMTILMGVVANYPMALAAGLGINAMVAYTLVGTQGMTYADAMGLIVIEGIIILVLVLTGFREAVFKAVPDQLKTAISVGIGLFIALIGLVDAKMVRRGGTPLELGLGGSLQGWPVLVFLFGLFLMVVLHVRKVRGAILIGIASATVLAIIIDAVTHLGPFNDDPEKGPLNLTGWSLSEPRLDGFPVDVPSLSTLGHFSLLGSVHKVGIVSVILLVFSLLLADFFDTMGTMSPSAPRATCSTSTATRLRRARSSSSTPWPPSLVVSGASPPTPPTWSPPRAWGRGPARAWPRWSPAACSPCPCSSHRWSRWSPTRRLPRHSSWSVSS